MKKKMSMSLVAKEMGGKLLPDNESHTNRMQIKSESSDRLYIVAQNQRGVHYGRWECKCPGWIFRRNCKHLKAMAPMLDKMPAPKRIATKAEEAQPRAARKRRK